MLDRRCLLVVVLTAAAHVNAMATTRSMTIKPNHAEMGDSVDLATADATAWPPTSQPSAVRSLWPSGARVAAWVHIPKCSTSFMTTIVHWLDVDGLLPSKLALEETSGHVQSGEFAGLGAQLLGNYSYSTWASSGTPSAPLRIWPHCVYKLSGAKVGPPEVAVPAPQQMVSSQEQIDRLERHGATCMFTSHTGPRADIHNAFSGHFVAMFRDPRTRLISSFEYFFHDQCEHLNSSNISAYAQRVEGTVTKQVAGQESGVSCLLCPSAAVGCDTDVVPDVTTALARLDAYSFIGDTDDYASSVCLFHAKLGGECFAEELTNSRPTSSTTNRETLDAELGAYADPYDSIVVGEALRRYRAEKAAYNVTPANCRHICPALAHAFPDADVAETL